MNKEEFEKKLLELAACELSPEEWESWWTEHEAFVEGFVSRGDYLRLKLRRGDDTYNFRWAQVVSSREGAIQYLVFKAGMAYADVPHESPCKYQKNYDKEWDEFWREHEKQKKAKEKELLDTLKRQSPQLLANWPRFGKSLKNIFCEGDEIGGGVSDAELETFPLALPADIKAFFRVVSKISLEGINIDFAELRPETLCGAEYLMLGEFWKEADGDLLLVKADEAATPTPIYYYFHVIDGIIYIHKNSILLT